MTDFWLIIWLILGTFSVIALSLIGIKLSRATKRISRSIDPIDQKIKVLRLEVSALQRARADRQRRLKKDNYSTTEKG